VHETRRFVFVNFARSTLAARISASATQLRLAEGEGDRFPEPDGTYDEICSIVLKNSAQYEVMYCTGRVGDVLTVERGKEGTTAQIFALDTPVVHNATAGFFEQLTAEVPVIESLNPATVEQGSPQAEIEVVGTGFEDGAVVTVNGSARVTFVDTPTSILFDLLDTDQVDLATLNIVVTNPDGHVSNTATLEVVEASVGIAFVQFYKDEVINNALTVVCEVEITGDIAGKTNLCALGHFIRSNANPLTNYVSTVVEVLNDDVVVATLDLAAFNIGDTQVGFIEVSVSHLPFSIPIPNDIDFEAATVVRVTQTYSSVTTRRCTLQFAVFENVDHADVELFDYTVDQQLDGGGTISVGAFPDVGALVFSCAVIAASANVMTVDSPAGFTVSDFDDVASFFNHGLAYWIADAAEEIFVEWTPADQGLSGYAWVIYPAE
jgi:hypothetical protein